MKVDQFVVNINSEQPETLIAFYRDIVGLRPNEEMGTGAFMAGSSSFIIEGHSEVKGATKEPQRVLLNFLVSDLASEETRLKEQGVQFIMSATVKPHGLFATFLDPDGNYCQLVELER